MDLVATTDRYRSSVGPIYLANEDISVTQEHLKQYQNLPKSFI